MVLNSGKCYCMTFGLNITKNEFVLEVGAIVSPAEEHVVLGITIDSRLSKLCKKVANKLNTLTRIAPYLSNNQRRLIYSSFFIGQLSYGRSFPDNQIIL